MASGSWKDWAAWLLRRAGNSITETIISKTCLWLWSAAVLTGAFAGGAAVTVGLTIVTDLLAVAAMALGVFGFVMYLYPRNATHSPSLLVLDQVDDVLTRNFSLIRLWLQSPSGEAAEKIPPYVVVARETLARCASHFDLDTRKLFDEEIRLQASIVGNMVIAWDKQSQASQEERAIAHQKAHDEFSLLEVARNRTIERFHQFRMTVGVWRNS